MSNANRFTFGNFAVLLLTIVEIPSRLIKSVTVLELQFLTEWHDDLLHSQFRIKLHGCTPGSIDSHPSLAIRLASLVYSILASPSRAQSLPCVFGPSRTFLHRNPRYVAYMAWPPLDQLSFINQSKLGWKDPVSSMNSSLKWNNIGQKIPRLFCNGIDTKMNLAFCLFSLSVSHP